MHTQYSAPPTHHADSLAHHQSEYPKVQMANSQPPQTSHVELCSCHRKCALNTFKCLYCLCFVCLIIL